MRSELCFKFDKRFSEMGLCLEYWTNGTFYNNLDDDKTLEPYHIDSDVHLQMKLPLGAHMFRQHLATPRSPSGRLRRRLVGIQ